MEIVPYTSKDKPAKAMRIVSYPPACYVRMLGMAADNLKLWLHWRGKHSYPCMGAQCVDCRDDRFPFGYCPVQRGKVSGLRFYPEGLGILPVTPEGLDLCLHDLQGSVIEVSRFPYHKRGQTTWKKLDYEGPPIPRAFDVLPHLELLWQWFDKRDRARPSEPAIAPLSDDDVNAVCGRVG